MKAANAFVVGRSYHFSHEGRRVHDVDLAACLDTPTIGSYIRMQIPSVQDPIGIDGGQISRVDAGDRDITCCRRATKPGCGGGGSQHEYWSIVLIKSARG